MSALRTDPQTGAVRETTAANERVPRVRVAGLSKRYGYRGILRGIDLEVWPGERVVLLGPNGAGKTTLLRILATLSRPTTGTLAIDGLPAGRHAEAIRRRVGVVAHQPYLYDDLTAAENLRFFARMYDVPDAPGRIDDVLRLVGLARRRDERVRTFSRGMRQRLALARATLHRPSLLLLDEPDSGLDREGVATLTRIIDHEAESGGSVLFTTHDLLFALKVADRVVLMRGGRLSLDVPAGDIGVEEIEQRLGYRG